MLQLHFSLTRPTFEEFIIVSRGMRASSIHLALQIEPDSSLVFRSVQPHCFITDHSGKFQIYASRPFSITSTSCAAPRDILFMPEAKTHHFLRHVVVKLVITNCWSARCRISQSPE